MTGLNETHGRKFADIDATGNPGGVSITTAWSVPPVTLTAVPTAFNSMEGIDYHEPTSTLVVSVNSTTSHNPAFERINADGTHVAFSSAGKYDGELVIYTVRSGAPAGWTVGDVFSGNGQSGQILRVSNGGNSVQAPWVTLPGGVSDVRGFAIDRTGLFGGNMLVTTQNDGTVWSITPQGKATMLCYLGARVEGAEIIPDDPARYGPIAGKLVTVGEINHVIYAITPAGSFSSYAIPAAAPEDIKLIPANQNLFAIDISLSTLFAVPASCWAPMVGDLLVDAESHGSGTGLYDVHWNSTTQAFVTTQLTLTSGSAVPGTAWEHFAFVPAGVGSTSGTDQTGPGLPDWTINLKNSSGQIIATTTTDRNGNYSFTALASATYTVAEVPQTGWNQTAPASPGTYTITLTGGQIAVGADFGNVMSPVVANRAPSFATTPTTFAQVGQRYVYASHATDPDSDVLTYDLPVPVPGMAVDPATGIVAWTPTPDQAGNQDVILRVQDGRGGYALQSFRLQVAQAYFLPTITSTPVTTVPAGDTYKYQVRAVEFGYTGGYTFSVSGPSGMTINAGNGLISWPNAAQGTYPVTVSATDTRGNRRSITTR